MLDPVERADRLPVFAIVVFPRQAQLRLPLPLIVVVTVVRDVEDLARTRNRTLEAGRLEAESLAGLLPQAPLVSWKGSLGHTLGSCGLVELAVALAAVKGGTIPPTVALSGRAFAANVATNSFGARAFDGILLLANAFGGAHAATLITHGF